MDRQSKYDLLRDVVPVIRVKKNAEWLYDRVLNGNYTAKESEYISPEDYDCIDSLLKQRDSSGKDSLGPINLILLLHDGDDLLKVAVVKCNISRGDDGAHEYILPYGNAENKMRFVFVDGKGRFDKEWFKEELERCPTILNLKQLLAFSDSASGDEGYISVVRSKSLAQSASLMLSHYTDGNVYWCSRPEDGCEDDLSRERLFKEEGDGNYRRDYNRIVQSRAFRRMVDKAQIYGAERGIHYRTRMTHTLVVARIAREIASRLVCDELLAETIALAHDLGHTPFGHQGERTIKEMLEKHCGPYFSGGFKHNFQSVRVLAQLEESYPDFVGLNVSWKVLEGALHHTKATDDKGEPLCNFFELDPMYLQHKTWFDENVIHGEYKHSCTLEGQIVAIADEIAQRSHDIDDGIMSERMTCEEIVELLGRFGMTEYKDRVQGKLNTVRQRQYDGDGRTYATEIDVLRSAVSETVMQMLIDDVYEGSKEEVEKNRGKQFVDKPVITFTDKAKALNGCLEGIIKRRVLSSTDVAEFDVNAHHIVASLYDRFLQNPELLPEEVLRRFMNMQTAAGLCDVLDFSNCDFDARRFEIKFIRDYGRLLTERTSTRTEYERSQRDLELRSDLAITFQELLLYSTHSAGKTLDDNPDDLYRDENGELHFIDDDDEGNELYATVDDERRLEKNDFWVARAPLYERFRNLVNDEQLQYLIDNTDREILSEIMQLPRLTEDPFDHEAEWSHEMWLIVSEAVKDRNMVARGTKESDLIDWPFNIYVQVRPTRYIIKWLYLNRVIADYIADMTDTMARDEFARVCQYR